MRQGDFSRDGLEDVIAREASTGKLWLYPGRVTDSGAAALGARKLIGSGGWNVMGQLVGAGDLNGDTRSDLVAVEKASGKLWFYPGKAGAYGSRVLIGSGWNSMASLLAVADYTGDGYNDLAAITGAGTSTTTCPSGDGCLLVYPGTGTSKLAPASRKADDWWGLTGAF
ncbi:VCBS repeat-containing protein [Streptomyces sp. NBC_01255]|uniref:FG-GAP repeat domain-containing protein n=1 Tax=Streptomyces sp. NBC_01255 TaxID=2903798 RepID=UPI002E325271|nr:VCBS repeat-containing protein [Streptomyces sp. NBC_01255]